MHIPYIYCMGKRWWFEIVFVCPINYCHPSSDISMGGYDPLEVILQQLCYMNGLDICGNNLTKLGSPAYTVFN